MASEDTPATKRDLNEPGERLVECMREIQTELLKAFFAYREREDLRMAAMEARQNAIELRFNSVEGRLAEIEKKLLLNPPAA